MDNCNYVTRSSFNKQLAAAIQISLENSEKELKYNNKSGLKQTMEQNKIPSNKEEQLAQSSLDSNEKFEVDYPDDQVASDEEAMIIKDEEIIIDDDEGNGKVLDDSQAENNVSKHMILLIKVRLCLYHHCLIFPWKLLELFALFGQNFELFHRGHI